MTALAPAAFSDTDPDVLARLTRAPDKARLYAVDPYTRLGLRRLPVETALRTTFVVCKPDAVAGRRIRPTLAALTDAGFAVAASFAFRFTPLLTREVWRYQFNIASWDRADVVDLLLPGGDSLLLLLADRRWTDGALPAACRLAAMKGNADPAARGPGALRSLLRGPTTLFNFLHTADEPADVVRELALLETATGLPLLAAATSDPAPDGPDALIARLEAAQPAHDLDAERSWRRLADRAAEPVAALARRRLAGDRSVGWRDLLAATGPRPPRDALWDLLSVATAEIECNVPGLAPVLPTVPAREWLAEGAAR
ncbi:nucleoside-diphosphate kinase [Actinomadura atramentaria]|uniref:nucleoside-diphosphate kinase n=1 Tax=Actinomadura atramentaria TaxID=1990 RepID=UPI000371C90D|nr:nucleoside-diphosphate kinase [Actinomadura atramentaria]